MSGESHDSFSIFPRTHGKGHKDIYPGYRTASPPISERGSAPGAEGEIVDYVSDCLILIRFKIPPIPSNEQLREEREEEPRQVVFSGSQTESGPHAGQLGFLHNYFSHLKGKLG